MQKGLLFSSEEEVAIELAAYKRWQMGLTNQDFDDQVSYLLNEKIEPCSGGRLRATREALQLSSGELAKRLGILRTSYLEIEKSDSLGKIQLQTLEKIAKALECELIYGLRPKCRKRFSEIIWNKVVPSAKENFLYLRSNPRERAQALAAAVIRKLSEPQFIRDQGWSQRAKGFEKSRWF